MHEAHKDSGLESAMSVRFSATALPGSKPVHTHAVLIITSS
jgi:hypothetical protein